MLRVKRHFLGCRNDGEGSVIAGKFAGCCDENVVTFTCTSKFPRGLEKFEKLFDRLTLAVWHTYPNHIRSDKPITPKDTGPRRDRAPQLLRGRSTGKRLGREICVFPESRCAPGKCVGRYEVFFGRVPGSR